MTDELRSVTVSPQSMHERGRSLEMYVTSKIGVSKILAGVQPDPGLLLGRPPISLHIGCRIYEGKNMRNDEDIIPLVTENWLELVATSKVEAPLSVKAYYNEMVLKEERQHEQNAFYSGKRTQNMKGRCPS